MAKVAVAMSGGVDSSVAALWLLKQGHEVQGVTFRLFGDGRTAEEDAAAVCRALGIGHRVADYREEFERTVVTPFVEGYLGGRTPNPCIFCNRSIKFGRFLCESLAAGFDAVATGHYARVERGPDGAARLCRAPDRNKDQSYVLYMLPQEALSRVILPLGVLSLPKEEIRSIARRAGLPVAERPDSQDICFIPEGGHAAFIRGRIGNPAGEGRFVLEDGTVAGRHGGVFRYTVGQRKGLGVSLGRPAFVKKIDPETGDVLLTADEGGLFHRTLFLSNLCLNQKNLVFPLRAKVRIRYAHREQDAEISLLPDGGAKVVFDEAQRAPTAGQAAVFYRGDEVVGGGTIERAEP